MGEVEAVLAAAAVVEAGKDSTAAGVVRAQTITRRIPIHNQVEGEVCMAVVVEVVTVQTLLRLVLLEEPAVRMVVQEAEAAEMRLLLCQAELVPTHQG
jgi:hypothetical protein